MSQLYFHHEELKLVLKILNLPYGNLPFHKPNISTTYLAIIQNSQPL